MVLITYFVVLTPAYIESVAQIELINNNINNNIDCRANSVEGGTTKVKFSYCGVFSKSGYGCVVMAVMRCGCLYCPIGRGY